MSKKKDKNPEIDAEQKETLSSEAVKNDLPEAEAEAVSEPENADPAAEIKAELAAEKDRYLRLAAEYDNYRKRSLKEREALFADIKADTVTKILPIYDSIARALAIPCSDEAFYKGIEMTMAQLTDAFDKLGIKKIPAVGEKFNPELHNAVMHIEDESLEEGTIVEEFQAGFMIGEKVVRFSMVKVAN